MLKSEFLAAKQPWLSEDVRAQFERRQQLGPNYGDFPESSKSILVVAPHNIKQVKVEFTGLDLQVETGSRLKELYVKPRKETVGVPTQ